MKSHRGPVLREGRATVRVLASESVWMEDEAIRQLERAAELPGMHLAVGLPDLHPGNGIPVGAAFLAKGILYPHLLGNDVGCGMALWSTDLRRRKMKREQWMRRLRDLDSPWEVHIEGWLSEHGLAPLRPDDGLGTIGGGNHFAELQVVEEILDPSAFQNLGLVEDGLVLLVHSGSRGLGEALFRSRVEGLGGRGVEQDTEAARRYLHEHDALLRWAETNRSLIAHRFLSKLGAGGRRILDLCHNSVTRTTVEGGGWLHRKGAAPADRGPVVIPGSRGSLTYLAAPHGDQAANAFSTVHGAGRKWKRSDARSRLARRYRPEALVKTDLGGWVICEDRDLLYEEAPQAYKDIDGIVSDLVARDLIRVIARFRPLITYKMRRHT